MMGLIAQIRAFIAATGMSVHRICRENALTQSTHIIHTYGWKVMGQGGSHVVSLYRVHRLHRVHRGKEGGKHYLC